MLQYEIIQSYGHPSLLTEIMEDGNMENSILIDVVSPVSRYLMTTHALSLSVLREIIDFSI